MRPLALSLRMAGYRTLNLAYPSLSRPLGHVVDALADEIETRAAGRIHFVTHSMGGLVLRALLARRRPAGLGRAVMLGPPNDGSEWVDMLARMGLDRLLLRHARDLLSPSRPDGIRRQLGEVDYPLRIIAGDWRFNPLVPRHLLGHPHDGRVSVAATRLAGAADHIVLGVPHTLMLVSPRVHRQAIAFLEQGHFIR